MKIAEVTHRYPPRTGGVEQHVYRLSNALADRGHKVDVLAADLESGEAPYENGNPRVFRFKTQFPYRLSLDLIKAVRDDNYDVIHAHNYHSLPAPSTIIATDPPSVFTTHYHGTNSLIRRIYAPFGRYAVNESDAVIAVSEWEAEQLACDFSKASEVIPHGLDYDRFGDDETYNDWGDYVLYVGRIDEYKHIEEAIPALELLDLNLLIVSNDPWTDALRRAVYDSNVEVGHVSGVDDDDLKTYYAGAELTINLSSEEAFGMAVGESLACGTPVAISGDMGLSRWMDTQGVTVARDLEPAALSETFQRAMNKPVDTRPLPSWPDVASRVEEVLINET